MEYLITKTDISLNGIIHSEGSTIDSARYKQEEIESVIHLLVPLEKSSSAVTLDLEETEKPQSTASEEKTKRSRKSKQ